MMFEIGSLVRVLASQWDNIKNQSGAGSDENLYNTLVIAAAHDVLMPLDDYEAAARMGGWVPAVMSPGMVVRGIVGQPMAKMALGWQAACQQDKLVVPEATIRFVYIVDERMYAHLSLIHERVTELAGHLIWATARDAKQTGEFLGGLETDAKDAHWAKAIAEVVERNRKAFGQTAAQEQAQDKWEQNSG